MHMADVKDMFNKKNNEEASTYIEENNIPAEETLSAEEWNQLGKRIKDIEDKHSELDKNAVKIISQNDHDYLPDEQGKVTLPSFVQTTVKLKSKTPSTFVEVSGTVELQILAESTINGTDTFEQVKIEVQTAPIGSDNYSIKGSFTISAVAEGSDEYTTVNITKYLDNGAQQVYLVATGIRTNVKAYFLYRSITKTELSVEYARDLTQPILASNFNGIPIALRLTGTVDRTIHILIEGTDNNQSSNQEVTYTVSSTEYTSFMSTWKPTTADGSIPDTGSYGTTNHGVHTVTVWITCDDGRGNTLGTDKEYSTKFQVMVINESTLGVDLFKPHVMLHNVLTKCQNYVAIESLASYSVWVPSKDNPKVASDEGYNLQFLVTNYKTATTYDEEYVNQQVTAYTGNLYSLPMTIEIEDSVNDTVYGYFRMLHDGKDILAGNNPIDVTQSYIVISVANNYKFNPTVGADFILNPKNRNNTENNPAQIFNAARASNHPDYIVPATFEGFEFRSSDGWIKSEDNQKVLRVLAGQRLIINKDIFASFKGVNAADLTIELDIKTRNVSDEDNPIISMFENITTSQGSRIIGIRMNPMAGVVCSNSKSILEEQDFYWQEEVRTHIVINIGRDVRVDENSTLPLCRVFINGKINREFRWSKSIGEWYNKGTQLVIGQDHADIDIYSIRIYSSALSSSDVVNDHITGLPTIEAKLATRSRNDIIGDNGYINKTKAQGKHMNCLIFHATSVPDYYNPSATTGYLEIQRYDVNGKYLARLSGTICRETASLKFEGQGSTAKTYEIWNQQMKTDKVKATIKIALSLLDQETFGTVKPSIDESDNKLKVLLKGGNLDGYYEVDENNFVTVPDGWIDGNGNYRGIGFISGDAVIDGENYNYLTGPQALKLCNKINYASSMQAHKIGCTRAYNDLHKLICGEDDTKGREAILEDPYLCFIQKTEESEAVFQGPGTFGSAKGDKPTFGYNKKKFPLFCMIEGSDNSLPLTDFRVPFDNDVQQHVVVSDSEVDGWSYNGQVSFDYSMGATVKVEGIAVPLPAIEAELKKFVNFLYTHNPRIKCFVGTYEEFMLSTSKDDTGYKYWCTAGEKANNLLRYNFVTQSWVDAGYWNASSMEYVDSVYNLKENYSSIYNKYQGRWDSLNAAIIDAVAAEAKSIIDKNDFIDSNSLKFHYNYINQKEAGTDNNSKNTYYVLTYINNKLVWRLKQDDLDTIKKTDNSGQQTKPYYILRNFDVTFKGIVNSKPVYETANNYVGKGNVLFNLCDVMYEKTGENRAMMKRIFTAMCQLVSDYNRQFGTNYDVSPWGFEELYFFRWQEYFSEVVYNEAARIRYEGPESRGFVSERGVYPLTQSMGDQLEAEKQYYKRRLIMLASYAQWGNFDVEASSASIGISDAAEVFGTQTSATLSGLKQQFVVNLTPHQFIYPNARLGQSNVYYGSIVAPGEPVRWDVTSGAELDDTVVGIYAANYYRSFGNLGDLSVKVNQTFTLRGKRLVEFTAVPTQEVADFRPQQIAISAPLLESIQIKNCPGVQGTLNLSECNRLLTIDLRGTSFEQVNIPESHKLNELYLPAKLKKLDIENREEIKKFELQGISDMESCTVVQSADIIAHNVIDKL